MHPVCEYTVNVELAVTSDVPEYTLKLPLAGVKLDTVPVESAAKVVASFVNTPTIAAAPSADFTTLIESVIVEPSVIEPVTITPCVVPRAVLKFAAVIVTVSPVVADKYVLAVSAVPSALVIVHVTVAVVFCFCAVNVVV